MIIEALVLVAGALGLGGMVLANAIHKREADADLREIDPTYEGRRVLERRRRYALAQLEEFGSTPVAQDWANEVRRLDEELFKLAESRRNGTDEPFGTTLEKARDAMGRRSSP